MDSLIKINNAINNKTHESFLIGITLMQMMFLRVLEFHNARVIYATKEENIILPQLMVEDIDRFCK